MATSQSSALATNAFSIATLSLGNSRYHSLEDRVRVAAAAGFKTLDLFDEDWSAYLSSHGGDGTNPWEATPDNLHVAHKLRTLVELHGISIACTQPLRKIEGLKNSSARKASLELVAKRFPFMRALDTDLVFMCASVETEPQATSDFQTVARDLAELGRMAEEFSLRDGGRILRIGYEGLSWATRNTWASSWEVVRAANRHNVGLILDSFNILAVEFADPYSSDGNGMFHASRDEALDVLRMSMASLVATVPGDRIFFVQLADAELVSPQYLKPNAEDPRLLPWSRQCRLYPYEQDRGAYMPVDIVTAAILATGYQGPLSLEVFSHTLNEPSKSVPEEHARRGYIGLERLIQKVLEVPCFWGESAQNGIAYKMWKGRGSAGRMPC